MLTMTVRHRGEHGRGNLRDVLTVEPIISSTSDMLGRHREAKQSRRERFDVLLDHMGDGDDAQSSATKATQREVLCQCAVNP